MMETQKKQFTRIEVERMRLTSEMERVERRLHREIEDMKLIAERDLQGPMSHISDQWYTSVARKLTELVAERDSLTKQLEIVSEENWTYLTTNESEN